MLNSNIPKNKISLPIIYLQKILLSLLLLLEIFSNNLYSQYKSIPFEYLTADEGLSDNFITAIYRDSKDYLWIGTSNEGLNKYNSKSVTLYEHIAHQPGLLSDNYISCIFEDSRKNLWIGTADGINLYNSLTETYTVYRNNTDDNYVSCIIEDKKGSLWVTFKKGGGLCKFIPEKDSLVQYRINSIDNDYTDNSMTSIREDSKGNLWVVSRGKGIHRFEPETGKFNTYCDPDIDFGGKMDKIIYIEQNDNIWIGSNGKGLYLFTPSTGEFIHFGTNIGDKGPNSQKIRDIINTNDNHLLIATDQGGINKLDLTTHSFEFILQEDKLENGLNNNGILCLHIDKEGILWIGTTRGGVNYCNPKKYNFNSYKSNPGSLSHNIVGCFYEDSEGLIWIGTDGGGINVFDPQKGDFTIIKNNLAQPNSLSGNVVRCISEDSENNIWIGTWDSGLNMYDRNTKKFHHYSPKENDTSRILGNTIWQMHIDYNDNLWLAFPGRGIEIFNKKKGVIKRYITDTNNPTALSSNEVWLIYKDSNHNIWICTENGINLYDSISDSFTVYNNFPHNNFGAFCRDKKDRLWAGGINTGLFQFKLDGTIVNTFDKNNGLPDNTIHAIVEDNNGNLWITTNKGLCKFNQEIGEFKIYYKTDGLQGNVFFQQSFLKTKDGKIYFGGYKGFNSFYPDSLQVNDFIPKVYITDFKIFNKPIKHGVLDSPLQNHISETKEIKLSWKESVFSFEFVAINYTDSEKNQYAYIMDGFEKEWNYVGNLNIATYTNLDPGEYTFKLKASNNDGVWNQEETSIKIIVTPPIWKTWGFISFEILLAISLIFGAYFYRIRSIRLKNQVLEQTVNERTQEISEKSVKISAQNEELEQHRNNLKTLVKDRTIKLEKALLKAEGSDRLKSAFLANMSHEIRTPMNAITGFADLLDEDDLTREERKEYTEIIQINSNGLLKIIDEIIDLSLIESNQLKLIDATFELNVLIDHLYSYYSMSNKKPNLKIKKNNTLHGQNLKLYSDFSRIKQVLTNLMDNAYKFTEEGYIELGVHAKDNQLFIYIEDTGRGIPQKEMNNIFQQFTKVEDKDSEWKQGIGIGLSISQRIADALGANILVESTKGKGSLFTFSISMNKAPNQSRLKDKIESVVTKPKSWEGRKILIAEDIEANYRYLKQVLIKMKAEVIWAKTGKEAVKQAIENGNIDLILMDIKMPILNGIEAAKIIKKYNPNQIIIAQTAYSRPEERIKFKNENFDAYLTKPINKIDLVMLLEDFLFSKINSDQ